MDSHTCPVDRYFGAADISTYRDGAGPLLFAPVVALWVVLGTAAVLAAGLAMMPWPLWRDAALSLGSTWHYAAFVALLGTSAWQWSERLWDPTASLADA